MATVTLKDIAQTLDVSVMTVSKVMRNRPGVKQETRNRVLAKRAFGASQLSITECYWNRFVDTTHRPLSTLFRPLCPVSSVSNSNPN
jgi:hypothetical protein